jgi:type IV pilus assembly protein PilQ
MTRLHRLLLAAALLAPASPALAEDGPASGEVTGVSVLPAPGKADVVINVRGAVQVRDFMLHAPDRLVVDVVGAKLSTQSAMYDGVNRGGVVNLRYSQFRPDVVRIVLDLQGVKDYKVAHSDAEVRVSFGSQQGFAAWSSASAPSPAVATAAEEPVRDATAVAPAAPAREPEVKVSQIVGRTPLLRTEQPRITVTWDHASIADVAAGFAAFSGRTIILGKDIKGDVSAEIKNQPWDQAFQAILATQGLAATEMTGGIIRVDAPAALAALDSLEPLESRQVPINYTPLGQITKSVETLLTKGRGRVVADSASSSLIVTDTRSRVDDVTRFVSNLDRKTPQILIKAKIVFVDRTDLERLGLRYDLGSANQAYQTVITRPIPPGSTPFPSPAGENAFGFVDLGGNTLSAIGNANGKVQDAALSLVFSTILGGSTLTSFLSALQQQQLADIQAEPTISTLDNRKADILVGEETPVPGAPPAQGSAVAVQQTQFKETGIRLTVTPHVTNSGQILMSLRTERSAVQNLPASQFGFNFTKQTTENQLLVNDGETAVIGGLTITEINRTRSGIPLLSQLPIVGGLFSTTEHSERRRDLMILVTPRVVDDNSSLN